MSELLPFTAMTKLLTKAFEEFILAHGLRAQPIIVGKAERQVRNEEASRAASEVRKQGEMDGILSSFTPFLFAQSRTTVLRTDLFQFRADLSRGYLSGKKTDSEVYGKCF